MPRGYPTEGWGPGVFRQQDLPVPDCGPLLLLGGIYSLVHLAFLSYEKSPQAKRFQSLATGQREYTEVVRPGGAVGEEQGLHTICNSSISPSVKWEGCRPWWLSSLPTFKACQCHDVVLVHNALTTLCFHSWFLFSNKMPVPGAGIFIQLDNSFAEKISLILQVIYWKTVITVLWSPKKSWIINSALINEWFLFECLPHSAMKS